VTRDDEDPPAGLPDSPDAATGRPGPGFGAPSFDPLSPPHDEPPFDTRRGGAGGVGTLANLNTASVDGTADEVVEPTAGRDSKSKTLGP